MNDQRTNSDTTVRMITQIKPRKLNSNEKDSGQFSKRFFYFVNHSRLHGIRYLDHKYSIIER